MIKQLGVRVAACEQSSHEPSVVRHVPQPVCITQLRPGEHPVGSSRIFKQESPDHCALFFACARRDERTGEYLTSHIHRKLLTAQGLDLETAS